MYVAAGKNPPVPKEIALATEKYRLNENPIREFLDDVCESIEGVRFI
jgi:hypothetical protein